MMARAHAETLTTYMMPAQDTGTILHRSRHCLIPIHAVLVRLLCKGSTLNAPWVLG